MVSSPQCQGNAKGYPEGNPIRVPPADTRHAVMNLKMVVLCGLAAELHGFSASSRAHLISRRPTKRGIGVDGNGLGIGVVGTGDGRAEGTGVKREPSRSSELPAQALVASSAAVAAFARRDSCSAERFAFLFGGVPIVLMPLCGD